MQFLRIWIYHKKRLEVLLHKFTKLTKLNRFKGNHQSLMYNKSMTTTTTVTPDNQDSISKHFKTPSIPIPKEQLSLYVHIHQLNRNSLSSIQFRTGSQHCTTYTSGSYNNMNSNYVSPDTDTRGPPPCSHGIISIIKVYASCFKWTSVLNTEYLWYIVLRVGIIPFAVCMIHFAHYLISGKG